MNIIVDNCYFEKKKANLFQSRLLLSFIVSFEKLRVSSPCVAAQNFNQLFPQAYVVLS